MEEEVEEVRRRRRGGGKEEVSMICKYPLPKTSGQTGDAV